MDKRRIKVAVGVPTKGQTESTAYDNHLEFWGHLGKLEMASKHDLCHDIYSYPEGVEFEFYLIVIPRIFPALARELIAEHAIRDGCDYLLMYDDDMILPTDMFERLFAHQVDIVAPLAFTRLAPFRPVIYNLTSGYDPVQKEDYYINFEVPNYPRNQLTQVDAIGFGAVLIDLKVLKSLPQKWFMTTSGAGEDIHFCHKAGKAGFKVFVDTSVKLGHLGERLIVTEEIYDKQEPIKDVKVYGEEKKYG